MSINPIMTSDQGKNHKRHFNEPSHICTKIVFPFYQRAETEIQGVIYAHPKGLESAAWEWLGSLPANWQSSPDLQEETLHLH